MALRHTLLGLLLLTAGEAAPARITLPAAPICRLTVLPVEVRGVSYRARLDVSPACPPTAVFRVRKSSTLNRKMDGAPYQPIFPDGSAKFNGLYSWTVGRSGSNIPPDQLWTSFSWEWQRYDPAQPAAWPRVAGGPDVP